MRQGLYISSSDNENASGESYQYGALYGTYRTAKGPPQRVLATLGKLDGDEADAGWDDIEALLEGYVQDDPRR